MRTAKEISISIRDLLQFYSVYPNANEKQLICLEEQIKHVQSNTLMWAAEQCISEVNPELAREKILTKAINLS